MIKARPGLRAGSVGNDYSVLFIKPVLLDIRHLHASPHLLSQSPYDISNIIFSDVGQALEGVK